MADSDPGNRLPKTQYNVKYPYCQTHVSRAGHEKHIDDTPGHERIREGHKSGTYWEITEDGRRVTLVVANEYQYVKGGLTLTIDNNNDILVNGNYKLVVKGDLYQEVDGNSYTITKGNSTNVTLGDAVTAVGGNAYHKVKGNLSASVDGNLNGEVKGDAEISVQGDASIVATGSIDLKGSEIRVSADGACTIMGNPVNIVG